MCTDWTSVWKKGMNEWVKEEEEQSGLLIDNLLKFLFCYISDNMKDAIIAKLASSCEDLYGECLKLFQRENLKQLFEKEWISIVSIYC